MLADDSVSKSAEMIILGSTNGIVELGKLLRHTPEINPETMTLARDVIEYLEQILKQYIQLCGFDPASAVRGRGHHKTPEQRYYDKLTSYIVRLKKYAEHIKNMRQ